MSLFIDIAKGGKSLTVDKLSENKVLVVLCTKDMEDFSLDFDRLSLNDIHSRKILLRIMQIACKKSGIEMKGKSISIEALSLDGGCYLLLTVNEKYHRTYRVKKQDICVCYYLGNSDNFLNTIEKLHKQNVYCNKNSAYEYCNEYYLIFDYPSIPQKLKRVLSEYGHKSGGNLKASKIRENGRLICKYNAITQIGQYL